MKFIKAISLLISLVALPTFAFGWLDTPVSFPVVPSETNFVGVGQDTNSDGFPDLLIGNAVYLGRAWGIETLPSQTLYQSPESIEDSRFIGDINGDGLPDAALMLRDPRRAVIYLGSQSGLIEDVSIPFPSSDGRFWSIGDINGDGFEDLARDEVSEGVSTIGCGGDPLSLKTVYVHLGSPTGVSAAHDWEFESSKANDCFGAWIAAGDLNGDSYSDMVVLASLDREDPLSGWSRHGKVYAFLGSDSGFADQSDWEASLELGPEVDYRFGGNSLSVSDADNDGFDDLLLSVGMDDKDGPRCFDYVFSGNGSGIAATPIAYDLEECGFDTTWWVGDVDGDGLTDVLLTLGLEGQLFLGPRQRLPSLRVSQIDGCHFFPAGDLNRDGFADFLCYYRGNQTSDPSVHIYFGKPNPVPLADPQSVSLPQNTDVDITLSGSDPYNDLLSFRIEREPEHGRLEAFSPSLGLVRYIPNYDYFGPDSFEFAVLDPYGGVGTAEVLIEVGRLNTAPVFVPPTPSTPVVVRVGEELRLVVRAEDAEEDQVQYTATGLPWNAEFDAETGVTYWIPDQSQLGPDTWVFSASDGTDTVTRSVVLVVEEATPDPPIEQDMGSTDQGIPPLPVDSGQGPDSIADQGCGCSSTKPLSFGAAASWHFLFVVCFLIRQKYFFRKKRVDGKKSKLHT